MVSASGHDLVTCLKVDSSVTFYCAATMTSRSIDFPRGRFVRLTRANSFGGSVRVVIPGQDGSCRDNKKRKKSNEGKGLP